MRSFDDVEINPACPKCGQGHRKTVRWLREEAGRTQRADFLALRSPVCFTSRLMGPILSERLSTSVAEPGSR